MRNAVFIAFLLLCSHPTQADTIDPVLQIPQEYETVRFLSNTSFVAQGETELAFFSITESEKKLFLKTKSIPGAFVALDVNRQLKKVVAATRTKVLVLDGLSGRVETSFFTNSHPVVSIAYAPDGKHVATGGQDHKIHTWEIATGQAVGSPMKGNQGSVTALTYSPDGRQIASGGEYYKRGIQIWDLTSRQATGKTLGDQYAIGALKYSPDGSYLGSAGHLVELRNMAAGHMLEKSLEPEMELVSSMAFSPDGRYLTVGGLKGVIQHWDIQSGKAQGKLINLSGRTENEMLQAVQSMDYSPNGNYLISVERNTAITLWDMKRIHSSVNPEYPPYEEGKPSFMHQGWIRNVDSSPNGKYVALGGGNDTVHIWDISSGKLSGRPLPGQSVAFSPNSQYVVTGDSKGMIRLWEIASAKLYGQQIEGHTSEVLSIAYSPDGSLVASAGSDGSIWLWNIDELESKKILLGVERTRGKFLGKWKSSIRSITFSSDGQLIAGTEDGAVLIWDTTKPAHVKPTILGKHEGGVLSVSYSSKTGLAVSGGRDDLIKQWDLKARMAYKKPIRANQGEVWSVTYSPDGRYIASGGYDTSIRRWDAETGQAYGMPISVSDSVWDLSYSPDGQFLVSGSNQADRWHTRTPFALGNPLVGIERDYWPVTLANGHSLIASHQDIASFHDLRNVDTKIRELHHPHNGNGNSAVYSPLGHQAAFIGNHGKLIQLWNVADEFNVEQSIEMTESPARNITISADGLYLASSHQDGRIRWWEMGTGRKVGESTEKHEKAINDIAFSPDGNYLASGGQGGKIRIWNTKTGRPHRPPIKGSNDHVYRILYSLDGRYIVSANWDGILQITDLSNTDSNIIVDASACLQSTDALAIKNSTLLAGSYRGIAIIDLSNLQQPLKCKAIPASNLLVTESTIIAEHQRNLTFMSHGLDILGRGQRFENNVYLEAGNYFAHGPDLPFEIVGFDATNNKVHRSELYKRFENETVFAKITNQYNLWDQLVDRALVIYTDVITWFAQQHALIQALLIAAFAWFSIFLILFLVFLVKPRKLTQWAMIKSDDVAFPIKFTKFLSALNWFGHRERSLKSWLHSNRDFLQSELYANRDSVVERATFADLGVDIEKILDKRKKERLRIWFDGPGGCGKSSLAFQFVNTLLKQQKKITPILISREWDAPLEKSLCREELQINQRMLTHRMLNKLLSRGYLLLIVDALSEKSESHVEDLSRMIRENKAPLVFVTSRSEKPMRHEWSDCLVVRPCQITHSNVEAFVEPYGSTLSSDQTERITQAIKSRLTNGQLSPLFGRLIVDAIANGEGDSLRSISLIISYVKRLHDPKTFRTADDLLAASKFVAFLMIAENLRPRSMSRDSLVTPFLNHNPPILSADGSMLIGSSIIEGLVKCGLLIRINERLKFQYDPLSEYLGIYYAVESKGQNAGGLRLLNELSHPSGAEKYTNLIKIRDEIVDH